LSVPDHGQASFHNGTNHHGRQGIFLRMHAYRLEEIMATNEFDSFNKNQLARFKNSRLLLIYSMNKFKKFTS